MINQVSRHIYGQLVRQFISGRMTNDEYEQKYEEIELRNDDTAVTEIYQQVWLLYDDIKTHRMTGKHRLDDAGRRQIAQIVLFLNSDKEYQWPKSSYPSFLLLALLGISGITTLLLARSFPSPDFIHTAALFICVFITILAVA